MGAPCDPVRSPNALPVLPLHLLPRGVPVPLRQGWPADTDSARARAAGASLEALLGPRPAPLERDRCVPMPDTPGRDTPKYSLPVRPGAALAGRNRAPRRGDSTRARDQPDRHTPAPQP